MATHQKTSHGKGRLMLLSGIVCCAALAACATQDKTGAAAGIAVANAALTDAVTADASRFASGEIQSARKALSEADAAMKEEKYDRARLLALQAKTDADLARARTNSAKAQIAVNELNESTLQLRNELGRARQ